MSVGCTPVSTDETLAPLPVGRAMTRCECTDMSFEEVAQSIEKTPATIEEVVRRTGCGGNCTACLPDLKRFLASRG